MSHRKNLLSHLYHLMVPTDFYIQLIITRIRDSDKKTFLEIIDGRLPKLTKNFKSRNNILNSTKYVHELINDNDTLYLYLDY